MEIKVLNYTWYGRGMVELTNCPSDDIYMRVCLISFKNMVHINKMSLVPKHEHVLIALRMRCANMLILKIYVLCGYVLTR